jgi:hypothetical protein
MVLQEYLEESPPSSGVPFGDFDWFHDDLSDGDFWPLHAKTDVFSSLRPACSTGVGVTGKAAASAA